jgi:hypothetical protein
VTGKAWCNKSPQQSPGSAFDLAQAPSPSSTHLRMMPDAVNNAIDYAKLYSRSHDAVIRVHDEPGNVIETREHIGEFKEW